MEFRRVLFRSYHQGLNLIASLHRTSFDTVDEIIVYSLGLEAHEAGALEALEKVRVLQYPNQAKDIFSGYLNPRHRAYKPMAIKGPEDIVRKDDLVLWMDAGLSALDDVARIFGLIESGDFFIADHDDQSNWPFRSEEHTSELQSLMRISYAVFCLNKNKNTTQNRN